MFEKRSTHYLAIGVIILVVNNGIINSKLLGDVTVAGIFEIKSADSDGVCGAVDVSSVMAMQAIQWYLDSVNRNGSLPFTIGLSEYMTCGNVGLAGNHAVDIISRFHRAATTNVTEDYIVGVLGPEYSSEAEVVSSILGSQTTTDRLLQISYSSTSTELNDRTKYPNYYRVLAEDDVQITTMVQLMLSLRWNRVGILYANDTYGRVGANTLQGIADKNNICISSMNAIKMDKSRQVDVSQIREILNGFVVHSPSIGGVVYFGSKAIANQMFSIFNDLQFVDVPIFILSESNLQTNVFQSASGDGLLAKTKGTLAVSVPYMEVPEFESYWNSLFKNLTILAKEAIANPYLIDVLASYNGCDDDTLSTCSPLTDAEIAEHASTQYVYVHYAMLATHTMIEALKIVYNTVCSGTCSSVSEFKEHFKPLRTVEAMDGLSITFDGIAASFTKNSPNIQLASNDKAYEVYNFRKDTPNGNEFKFVNVGYLSNRTLVLETDKIKDYRSDGSERNYPDVRRGQCPVGQRCSECIDTDIPEISYHIPGDFYVIGIVSINNREIPGPLGCGATRTRHGYQMYLSLKFSLKEFQTRAWYKQYKNMFAGKSIGLIVINSCNNALEVVRKLIDLHSKGLKLPDGKYMDVTNRILGYVGGQAADASEPAAVQLTRLGFVQISYSTTNPVLSNKQLYPYFLRIVTPDNIQAKAMIDIVKELGGDYIQIVYSEGAYGEGGRDVVQSEAAKANICIAQVVMVTESDRYYGYYEHMRKKTHAKIVIIFLRSHVVGPFMRDINLDMERGEFQFIGSEAWGKNGEILDYDISKGAIIVTVEMDTNIDLEEYLKEQIPAFNVPDPWLEEYIQKRQNCYFSWSQDKKFERECTDDTLPTNESEFESDPWCIFVFNSMISFLKGAAAFYNEQCGSSTRSQLCADYINNPDNLFEVLKHVTMDIYGTGEILIFDESGDGLMGYTIYNIQEGLHDKTERVYTQVGSYSPSTHLQFEKGNIRYPKADVIVSTCPSESACSECKGEEPTVSPPTDDNYGAAVPVLGTLVGFLLLAIVTMVVGFVYFLSRKKKNNSEDTYINPVYVQRPAVEGQTESNSSYQSTIPDLNSHNPYLAPTLSAAEEQRIIEDTHCSGNDGTLDIRTKNIRYNKNTNYN